LVVAPLRNATRKSAPSTGGPASTQSITSCTGASPSGARAAAEADGDDEALPVVVVGVLVAVGVAGAPAVRDGVIGVSSVPPGEPAGCWEHPATSADAANITAIRIRPG
jgi:hypothetical protein